MRSPSGLSEVGHWIGVPSGPFLVSWTGAVGWTKRGVKVSHKNHATSPHTKSCSLSTKHRENREKLPWELVVSQGVVTKLKTQIVRGKKPLKTQIVTKLKNSNCDKTQKLKFWQNSKTETETEHNIFMVIPCRNVTKFINSNCDKAKKENCDKTQNSNCDKTKKVKLQQNLKTQIVTKI